MMPPNVLTLLTNVPVVLAAIVGLVMMAWIPKPARLLAALGLVLVLGNAVWSLLEILILSILDLSGIILQVMYFVSYAALIGGLVLLVLAATVRAKPTSQAGPRGQPPHPPTPHHQPAPAAPAPPLAPNPDSSGSHPGT